jgi:selT/selW/selH-like putative selenoprotein
LKERLGYLRPEILVIGEEYPLPPLRAAASKVVSLVQTGLMVLGIGGNFIPAINNHPLYQRFQEKRMIILLGGYFGLNMLQNTLSTTGAFEVSVNGKTIFSKIVTSRMPTIDDLLAHL